MKESFGKQTFDTFCLLTLLFLKYIYILVACIIAFSQPLSLTFPNLFCGALFFLGKKLMYLDPHVTQSTVVSSNATNIPDEVCLCIVNLFMRKVF